MLMVGTDPEVVESDLVGGLLACPSCQGVLGPWAHGRWRALRRRGGKEDSVRPRRSICRGCRKTHLLLGNDAYDGAIANLRDKEKEFGAWESISRGADDPKTVKPEAV